MFHSKKLVLIAILGIVVAGSFNSVLIPRVWSQRSFSTSSSNGYTSTKKKKTPIWCKPCGVLVQR
jgi:hypothetical protein